MRLTGRLTALVYSLLIRASAQSCSPEHRMAIMMLARPEGELPFKDDWVNWRRGADDWARANGCDDGAPLDMFIHVAGNFKESDPPLFERVPAVTCKWGDLLPCESNLFRWVWNSTNYRDQTDWYALVSDDSVPVRTFDEIYRNLSKKNTTRIHYAARDFGAPEGATFSCAKHSQWILLRRDHMKLMVDGDWTTSAWLRKPENSTDLKGGIMAAPDEWAPGCYLELIRGGFDQLLPEINDSTEEGIEDSFMHVCWHDCNKLGTCLGEQFPCKWGKIYAQPLMSEIRASGAFFMRKVTPSSMVVADEESLKPISISSMLNFD